jgi:hypothetical protein
MIISKILQKLGIGDGSSNAEEASRRKHIRHEGVQAEVVVADRAFGLKDWSMGGLCFQPPAGVPIVAGDRIQFTLRFRLPHETVQIVQTGKVVRAVKRGIAAEFLPLSPEARRKFERVLDGVHAQGFMASQAF